MTAPTAVPLLDLHVPQDPDGTVAAVMPLAWCFKNETELAREIDAQNFVNPQLLIIDRQKTMKDYGTGMEEEWVEKRAIYVPLKQGLMYYSFSNHGEHTLLAFVVDMPNKTARAVLDNFVRHVRSSGSTSHFRDNGDYFPYTDYGHPNRLDEVKILRFTPDAITVNVPREMFAPPPAQWKLEMSHRVWQTPRSASEFRDQCGLRKRYLSAILLYPLVILLQNFFKLPIILISLLLAPRQLSWKTLANPLHGPLEAMERSGDISSWFFQKSRAAMRDEWDYPGNNSFRLSPRSALSPIVWLFPGNLVYIIACTTDKDGHQMTDWSYWGAIIRTDLVIIGFPLLVFGLITLGLLIAGLLGQSTYLQDRNAKAEAKHQKRQEEARAKMLRELELMTCGDKPPALSVGELPRDKRTINLIFSDAKTRVCKPFAK